MLILDTYSIRDLQNIAALLREADLAGFDAPAVLGMIEIRLEQVLPLVVAPSQQPTEPWKCPSCGRGRLTPANVDGIRIGGCCRCGYSEVVGDG